MQFKRCLGGRKLPQYVAVLSLIVFAATGFLQFGSQETAVTAMPRIQQIQANFEPSPGSIAPPNDLNEHKGTQPAKHVVEPSATPSSSPAPVKPLCALPVGVGPNSNTAVSSILQQHAASRDITPNVHFGKISSGYASLPTTAPKCCKLNTADIGLMCAVPGDDAMAMDAQALILTHKRVASVRRLITSLAATAPSHTGKLHLRVCVDVPKGSDSKPNAELMAYLETVQWERGIFEVGVQAEHAALVGQWLGCSRGVGLVHHGSTPTARLGDVTGRSEVISILEDDMEVSPHWLSFVLRAYRAYKHDAHVVAYALQRIQLKGTGGTVDRKELIGNPMVLTRVMSSWGFNARMDMWNDFVDWFHFAWDAKHVPSAPGTIMNMWYRNFIRTKSTHSMWTMWFIDYCTRYNLLTVFSNVGGDLAWGLNWMEAGEHFSGAKVPKADAKPVPFARDDVLTFPHRPVVLDWSGTPYDSPSGNFLPSPRLEDDAVRHLQCALARASAHAQGRYPAVAFVPWTNVGKVASWLNATADMPAVQARTVFVCEDEGCLTSLRTNAAAVRVGVVGHHPRTGGSASGRLGYLARVAAGGQPFAVFDVSAAWAERVYDVFDSRSAMGGGEGGLRGGSASAGSIAVVKESSGEGAFMPHGFYVPSEEAPAVQCLWALHTARAEIGGSAAAKQGDCTFSEIVEAT